MYKLLTANSEKDKTRKDCIYTSQYSSETSRKLFKFTIYLENM